MDSYQNFPINMKKDNISDYSMGMSVILSKDVRSKIDTPLEVVATKVGHVPLEATAPKNSQQ